MGNELKIYTSKNGKKFSITTLPKPSEGEVVYFTQREFDWLKAKNLTPQEFEVVWNLKRENHAYSPIPEEEVAKAESVADRYGKAIIEQLKRGVASSEGS